MKSKGDHYQRRIGLRENTEYGAVNGKKNEQAELANKASPGGSLLVDRVYEGNDDQNFTTAGRGYPCILVFTMESRMPKGFKLHIARNQAATNRPFLKQGS